MKKILLLLFSMICATSLLAQERLSTMPLAKRDSVLLNISQQLLNDKYPSWYRENVSLVVEVDTFEIGPTRRGHYLPKYVKTGDLFYRVKLMYANWRAEKEFAYPYTAMVLIIEKTVTPFGIMLGGNIGYGLLKPEDE